MESKTLTKGHIHTYNRYEEHSKRAIWKRDQFSLMKENERCYYQQIKNTYTCRKGSTCSKNRVCTLTPLKFEILNFINPTFELCDIITIIKYTKF